MSSIKEQVIDRLKDRERVRDMPQEWIYDECCEWWDMLEGDAREEIILNAFLKDFGDDIVGERY